MRQAGLKLQRRARLTLFRCRWRGLSRGDSWRRLWAYQPPDNRHPRESHRRGSPPEIGHLTTRWPAARPGQQSGTPVRRLGESPAPHALRPRRRPCPPLLPVAPAPGRVNPEFPRGLSGSGLARPGLSELSRRAASAASCHAHRFSGCTHHGRATGSVQGHHAHFRQARGGRNGARDGVWDVVELEVEEDAETELRELFDGFGTFGGEELASYLENACCPSQLPRQGRCWPGAVNVKGDN